MNKHEFRVDHIIRIGSWFLICLGVLTLIAWAFRFRQLLHILPGAPFITIDSGICILMSGAAFLSVADNNSRAARLYGCILAALGALYIGMPSSMWFSVHRLIPNFTAAVALTRQPETVRVAGASAINFALTGTLSILLAPRRPGKWALNIAPFLATALTAGGLLGILAIAAGLPFDQTWTPFLLRMALPTAVACSIAGLVSCAAFWAKAGRSDRQLPATLASLTALGLLLLIAGTGAAIFMSSEAVAGARAAIDSTWKQIHTVQLLVQLTRSAESTERGFLLTDDNDALAEFRQAEAQVRDQLSSDRDARTLMLHNLISRCMERLDMTVGLQLSRQHAKAVQVIRSGISGTLMRQIEHEADRLARESKVDLAGNLRLSARSVELMQNMVKLASLLVTLMAGLGFHVLRLEMRRRSAIESALRENEKSLERKVEFRTAELGIQAATLKAEIERRLQSEGALAHVNERLRVALDFAKIAVWTWNISEGVVTWSGPVQQVFDRSPADLSTFDCFAAVVHPDDRELINQRLAVAVTEHTDYAAEFRVLRSDGEVRWLAGMGGAAFDENGTLTRMAGVNFDISERKIAERALEQSERRFRELAEAMPQIVWTAKPNGEFDYFNTLWTEVTGLSLDQSRSAEAACSSIHPADAQRWTDAWDSMLASGQPLEIIYRFLDVRKQEHRWYLGRAVAVRDEAGSITRWFGTSTDIHQQRMAELQLTESAEVLRSRERQLASIFETGIVGDWSWDIAEDELRAHPGVWKLWGAPEGTQVKSSAWFRNLYHPLDAERIDQELGSALYGNGGFNIEFRIVRQDCSVVWTACIGSVIRDSDGRPIRTQGLNIDITERKVAEIRVIESERQLRQQADSMPQIAWTAKPDGSVEYYNHRWFEYTGQSSDYTADRDWDQYIHPDDFEHAMAVCSSGFSSGTEFELELRIRRVSDGAYRWHLARCVPYRDDDARLLRWFGTSTDIHAQRTEKDRLEIEICARTKELQHSLLEKETLLKEVHHRVKNNLQVISSLLRMQGESVTDSSAASALKDSQQRVLSMALIHERLYGGQQMDVIDFAHYTQTLVGELVYTYGRNSRNVTTRFDLSSVLLNLDQAIPCGLILNELVTNALKYAYPEGTSGEVAVELRSPTPRLVRLTVSDRGVGLPKGFNWQDAKTMGLPIVDILTKQIGGTLTVQSGPGATFTIDFPLDMSHVHLPAA